jgi:hypothetical protein
VGVCPISVPCGVALLLFAALNACCHARARGCILYFGHTLCLLCTERCGVSKTFFVSLSSSSRAPCCDDAVGQLVNRNEWLWWSWMCGWCGVGVLVSSVAGFVAPCSFVMPTSARVNAHHDSSAPPTCAHTQPFVDVISIKVLAGSPPTTGRKPSSSS